MTIGSLAAYIDFTRIGVSLALVSVTSVSSPLTLVYTSLPFCEKVVCPCIYLTFVARLIVVVLISTVGFILQMVQLGSSMQVHLMLSGMGMQMLGMLVHIHVNNMWYYLAGCILAIACLCHSFAVWYYGNNNLAQRLITYQSDYHTDHMIALVLLFVGLLFQLVLVSLLGNVLEVLAPLIDALHRWDHLVSHKINTASCAGLELEQITNIREVEPRADNLPLGAS